jgi:flagellar biosynthesis/type III secretory pathway M-ring protein FliF/YscJ
MFSKEMINLLIRIITSWQVIAVTVAFILYVFLVSYVARLYRRPRSISMFPAKPKFKKAKSPAASEEDGSETPETADDELGLEENT